MTGVTTFARSLRPGTLIAGTVLASAAGAAVAETFKLPVDTSAPGLMVLQDRGRIHVGRRAGGGPTVVFESGLGVPHTAWSWVIQNLPEEVAFLAYDRPGIGWSHTAPQSWRRDYPSPLQQLLRTMNVRPPLILVGHSIGGLLSRILADQHPDLVGGMVFVDPSPPRQYQRPGAAEGLTRYHDQVARFSARRLLGLPLPSSWTGPMRRLPEPVAEASVRAISRYAALRATRREIDLSASEWADGAARLTRTPHPVAVVTSGAVRRADPDYAGYVDEFAGLSDISHTDVVDDATHMSLLCDREHAVRVADAIRWVIASARPPVDDAITRSTTTQAAS